MYVENQVCSLELSKQLQKLGVKQKSLFYWVRMPTEDEKIEGYGLTFLTNMFIDKSNFKEIYSGFSVAELGEMLPSFIEIERDCYSDDEKYLWRIKSCENEIFDENETNARARMLILLIENKLMELPNE